MMDDVVTATNTPLIKHWSVVLYHQLEDCTDSFTLDSCSHVSLHIVP